MGHSIVDIGGVAEPLLTQRLQDHITKVTNRFLKKNEMVKLRWLNLRLVKKKQEPHGSDLFWLVRKANFWVGSEENNLEI